MQERANTRGIEFSGGSRLLGSGSLLKNRVSLQL